MLFRSRSGALRHQTHRAVSRPRQASLQPLVHTRAPSAELRENQTDQDSLPEYDALDAIVQRYMEQNQPVADIIAAGFAEADVQKIVRLIKINEYKRRQAPVGIRVTQRAFGRDWRYPITSRFKE